MRCLLCGLAAVAGAVYVFHTDLRSRNKSRHGYWRLLPAAPVLAVFTLLPRLFDAASELTTRASAAAMLVWLANFKVLIDKC